MLKIESEDVIANEYTIDSIMKGIWQKAMTYTVADPVWYGMVYLQYLWILRVIIVIA